MEHMKLFFVKVKVLIFTEIRFLVKKELVQSIKISKVSLIEIEDHKIKKTMLSKINIKNCIVIYSSSNIFRLSSSSKVSMSLIERCFPMIADSVNFLELDYNYITKILLRSGLNIDSELQIFNAADSWLRHDINERSKYAKKSLSKVRLSLLSIPALKQILDRVSSKYHECSNIIEAVLNNKQQVNSTSLKITSRYCNQTNFNILVCGGRNIHLEKYSNGVKLLNSNNLYECKNFPHMKEARCNFAAVCIKGEVYVFGGNNGKKVEKYSQGTKNWEYVTDMIDGRKYFCACSLMDNVYIFGGLMGEILNDGHELATCFELNTKCLKWKKLSRMNNASMFSACSVFEGRIVVSGGSYNFGRFKTVKAYDHVGNTWENMPNMINARDGHKSVAVKNKLFIVGGLFIHDCEVFDSTTNKFTLLKQPTKASGFNLFEPHKVIAIGSKIFVFQGVYEVKTYDFKNNEWSKELCEATKDIKFYSVLKYL